jgi:SAM-dependent methyltransferase
MSSGSISIVPAGPPRASCKRTPRLPFAARTFDLVISNHSLEHFDDLDGALREIGRVVKPGGALFVAVPDSSTFSDRLYRWLASGGGHVNPFTSADALGARIAQACGLRLLAIRTLCTSLACLNRKNRTSRAPRRLLILAGGREPVLVLLTYVLRELDRILKTRLSVYGWALYFSNIDTPIERRTWTNVCVRCGSGHSSRWLDDDLQVVRREWLVSTYRCPSCGAANLFTRDEDYPHLR